MHTYSPDKLKILKKHCLPARKLMATVFWDRKGVMTVEFMQQGITISSEVYCVRNSKKTAQGHSEQKARNTDIWCSPTRALAEHFNWELFDHNSYSPDLAPSDYNQCTYQKNWL
jgi:hypothetical protein